MEEGVWGHGAELVLVLRAASRHGKPGGVWLVDRHYPHSANYKQRSVDFLTCIT